jgi:hypothetical protein
VTKPLDYIVTHSGREVSLTRGVPSIEDLALSLSRQPRFGGMCRRHWTVVDHSLFTALLAQRDGQPATVQMACLLHDAHEWTGDIPTHFKHPAQRQLQRMLDFSIFHEYADASYGVTTKEYDSRALLAEAVVVGPPAFKTTNDVLEHFGKRPRLRDVVALIKGLEHGDLGVNPSELLYLHDARNTRAFIAKVLILQNRIKQETTAVRHNEPQGFVANEIKGEA